MSRNEGNSRWHASTSTGMDAEGRARQDAKAEMYVSEHCREQIPRCQTAAMVSDGYAIDPQQCGGGHHVKSDDLVDVDGLTRLAIKIFNGDSKAEAKFVSYFSIYLTKLLHSTFNDHQLCLDLYQETFASVIVKLRLGHVANPELLKSYISSTAVYLGYQIKRQRHNTENGNSLALESLIDREPTPYANMVNGELNHMLIQAIACLPQSRDRQLLTGFYLEQKQKSTICDECDLTALQFDRIHYRAKQRLKTVMLEKHFDTYCSL